MKTIGIMGGMSWSSTAIYYRVMNELVQKRLGGRHSAKIAMISVDFEEMMGYRAGGGWPRVAEEIVKVCAGLQGAGADFGMLGVNTLHIVFGEVEKRTTLPLLHIADATGAAIREEGVSRVGLLGTRYTMEEDFYKARLMERYGIDTVIPRGDDIEALHDLILGQLVLDIYEEPAREKVLAMIDRLAEAGAEGIILGCTELPELLGGRELPVPAFDTLRLHAEAAVARALA